MSQNTNKAIITVVGKDRKGIISGVSTLLAANEINILDISQTIVEDFFSMIMIVDMTDCTTSLGDIAAMLDELGKTIGMQITCQHEDIFQYMHRI